MYRRVVTLGTQSARTLLTRALPCIRALALRSHGQVIYVMAPKYARRLLHARPALKQQPLVWFMADETSTAPPSSLEPVEPNKPSTEAAQNEAKANEEDLEDQEYHKLLTPKEIVAQLDRFIVGQKEAKRAVAIAIRNRWRRRQLPKEQGDEIIPKNLLMIGPTGVGKTEIARRLAKLVHAPFIKVEATKYTEVGYHGKDVDQIIRDLVDIAINDTKRRLSKKMQRKIREAVEDRLLDALTGSKSRSATRESFRLLLQKGELENRTVDMELPESTGSRRPSLFSSGVHDLQHIMVDVVGRVERLSRQADKVTRKLTVAEARPLIEEQEQEKVLNMDMVIKEALESVEQDGIVFIDEIDKIAERAESKRYGGGDASSEGVQRDLLPIVEGTTINTKYGNVDTSKILFIASGAFHSVAPSDLIAELQGRLPIRVELKPLSTDDLYRILTTTENSQIKQQKALMKTEGVELEFTDEALREIAKIAADLNETVENIGARRLHAVVEKIVEDISFDCPQSHVLIDVEFVRKQLKDMQKKADLKKYIM